MKRLSFVECIRAVPNQCRWRIAANQNTGAPAMQFGIFPILWTNAGHIGPGSDFKQTCARLLPDCSQYPISSLD